MKPNTICFSLDSYKNKHFEIEDAHLKIEDARREMFDDISKFMNILVKNGYMCKFYCDEPCLENYVIQFDYKDEEMCGGSLEWEYCE